PRLHPAPDDRALEFSEDAAHLEHRPPRRRSRIERLLMEVQVAADALQLLEEADQMLQRAPKPVDAPRSDDIDFATHHRLQEPIELRTLIPAVRAIPLSANSATMRQPRCVIASVSACRWFSTV